MGISSYSTTPASNTSISGANLAEGCAPSGINDAIRQMMADIKTAAGDGSMIGDDQVTTVKILDANVTTAKIADANVTAAKLATDAVETAKIKDANVTTAKIADANVTLAKLATEVTDIIKVVDTAYAEYATNADIATIIPFDDTIPQITEGTQVLSVSITPKSVTNRLRVSFSCSGAIANATDVIVAALFLNGASNAIFAAYGSTGAAGIPVATSFVFEFVPASTATQTLTIRVGGAVGTIRLNGTTSSRIYGGICKTTVSVTEIKA